MAVRRRSKRRSSNRRAHVHKPAGSLSPRVQKWALSVSAWFVSIPTKEAPSG